MTRKLKKLQGSETIRQLEHVDSVDAQATTPDILAPGKVITDDISAAGVLVGKGSLVRIQVGADTYVAFGDDAIGAVSAATSPGLKLPAGYHVVRATDEFIRASANATRIEILSED